MGEFPFQVSQVSPPRRSEAMDLISKIFDDPLKPLRPDFTLKLLLSQNVAHNSDVLFVPFIFERHLVHQLQTDLTDACLDLKVQCYL